MRSAASRAGDPVTRAEVEAALRRVYGRDELDGEPSLLEELLDWLLELFDLPEGAGSSAGAVADAVLHLTLAVLVLLLLLLVARIVMVRARAAREARRAARAALEQRHEHVRALYREAGEALATGDLPRALRRGLFALVAGLGQRGSLEVRDAWTYREIVRHGVPEASTVALLSGLVRDLEAKEYGREPIATADVERVLDLCREHLGEILRPAAADDAREVAA